MSHRKTIRHYHEPGHWHEFTFSTYQRKPLLTNDDWCRMLARSLDAANEEFQFRLVAFVFMPEHVHLLTYPLRQNPEFGKYLARIKQPFSKQVKAILHTQRSGLLKRLTVRERPGQSCFRFRQEGASYDRNLFSSEAILHSIDYIHENPARRGLCQRAIEWKWSSAQDYLSETTDSDRPLIHGPPPGFFD